MMNETYRALWRQGPFLNQLDPFAEASYYFQQLHGSLISVILDQISDTLLELGYIASREASIQIAQGRKPDITIRYGRELPAPAFDAQYSTLAGAIMADVGILVEEELELDLEALYIRATDTQDLITVIEIISPTNKRDLETIVRYRVERERLFLNQAVNVIEIDLTRSIKRLFDHVLTHQCPYHTVIHFAKRAIRLITYDWDASLTRLAVPLRQEVVPVELQLAYQQAYRQANLAPQLHTRRHYTAEHLPFPTLLTDAQRDSILHSVTAWQAALQAAHTSPEK
jgi:hypothetical protein